MFLDRYFRSLMLILLKNITETFSTRIIYKGFRQYFVTSVDIFACLYVFLKTDFFLQKMRDGLVFKGGLQK